MKPPQWKNFLEISHMDQQFSIIGAGGHAKVVVEVIECMGGEIVKVFDSNPKSTSLYGYPITNDFSFSTKVIVAIGDNKIRKKMAEDVGGGFGSAIHPHANISMRCIIGEGSVIMAGATVNSNVSIGRHCIVNTNSSVDHDCRLGDFVHISPRVTLGGNVSIDEGSHIGIGSTIIQGTHIGKWVTIGAGAVIIDDVPDYAVVVGVPGNIIKYNPSLSSIIFEAIVVGPPLTND